MNDFYVYMYLDTDGIPFYVGKGRGRRHKIEQHTQGRKAVFVQRKIFKVGVENVRTHLLHKNLSEPIAFFWEKYWIRVLGRRDIGSGQLCNLTNGGEGNSGRVMSEEAKERLSECSKKNWAREDFRSRIMAAMKRGRDRKRVPTVVVEGANGAEYSRQEDH